MRKHHPLRSPSRARSEDKRGNRLCLRLLWQESDPAILGCGIRHFENFFKSPELNRVQSRGLQFLSQVFMFLKQPGADYDPRSITGTREVDHFIRRAFGVNWNAGSARLQDSEVSHSPFGRVVTEEHDSISGFDSLIGQERGGARSQFPQIGVSVLLFVALALDPHRDPCGVALGCSLEHLEQVAIGIDTLGLRTHLLFQRRQHPLFQAGHMDVHPVVVPVKCLGIPGEELLLVFANALEECAHVV